VLALLLLHPNEVVSTDRLIDSLWGERPPPTAANMLQGYVSRLRKALEPGHARGEHELLLSQPPGYVLRIPPEAVDAGRFERLAAEGRGVLEEGDARAAAAVLRQALALWRGPALADLAYEPFARPETDRLEDLRLSTLEDRIDAELALGRQAAVVGELQELVAAYPLRERLRGQLMLALYRAGRQAEALAAYRAGRAALRDALGIEPGPELRQLERAILEHAPELRAPAPPRPAGRRRRTLAVAAGVAVATAAATALVLTTQGGTRSEQLVAAPDSDVLLAAGSGRILRAATAPGTFAVRFGAGSLWSISGDGELTRIDPATGRTLASINVGVAPSGLAVGDGSVWVTDANSRTLVRVDAGLDVVAGRIALPRAGTDLTSGVTFAAGSVWVAHGGFNPGAWVDRLDPATGRVVHRFPILGGEATALAYGDGAIWVVSGPSGELRKLDPGTNTIEATVRLHPGLCCVAAGGGYVWAAVNPDGTVWKVGQDGGIVTTIQLPARVAGLVYGDGAVWAIDGDAGTVIRIDPTTDAERRYRLGHRASGVAAGAGLVAVGVEQSAQDVAGAIGARVVQVALKSSTLFWSGAPTDPALWAAFDAPQLDFQYATCAKLFDYPDVGGQAGKRLVPELAAAWPAISDGGRVYTFTIRHGYRFSPPSDAPVTAEAVRHTIERVVSPKFAWFEPTAADIAGAAAYHAGRAAHVSGLTVRGDTLTIRLVRPEPNLPRLLALSPYCVVPATTPVVATGIQTPIPSAGPYYLAVHTDSFAVLARNPGYHGPRPQHLDAIVYRFGVPPARAAVEIARGTLDYALETDPALAPDTAAARAAGPRYRLTPDATASTKYLQLNPARPLFADRRRRLAIEYALDRRALAAIDTARPATRLTSPRLPGYNPAPLYPLDGDDRKARRLLGGRRYHAVFATLSPAFGPQGAELARAVQQQLAAVGITVTIVPLTPRDFDDGGVAAKAARADLVWGGAGSDDGDPVDYLRALSLPPAASAELARIVPLAAAERDGAAAALARRLDREALYAVYEDGAIPELVSPRLGCIVHQPEYPGVDLAALCLKATR
jgi:ABC-type transport system substrate-binding protein/DNA-binding SARP family transcriptional activator